MKRFKYLTLLIVILCSLIACDKRHQTTNPVEQGNMPITMNLSPALQHGFNVTRVSVRITKGDFTDEMDMVIDSASASGIFTDLEMGNYAIDISVYEEDTLIAKGQGVGIVSPGQDTTVYITLQFEPGGLEVVINWGLPYEDCRRVLLVGNSHTYYNGGVNTHLQSLLNTVHPEWDAVIQAQTVGGYSLDNHYHDQNTINAIANGNWDLVILQENSAFPYDNRDSFYQYAEAMNTVVSQNGALTGLYMTWAWGNIPQMYEPVVDAYNYIGAYLDALVIPCGIAFRNSQIANQNLNLYDADNQHTSIYGTYLVACTFLATIWNINPIGNSYYPVGIDNDTASFLQNIAWTTVQNYQAAKTDKLMDRLSGESAKDTMIDKEQVFQLAM